MMKKKLQNGIFYSSEPKIGNSCCVVFLKSMSGSTASEIGNVLFQLWGMLKNLENGKVKELDGVDRRNLFPGNLTYLIAYGPDIFSIMDIRRKKPTALSELVPLNQPHLQGGGPIIMGSSIMYSKDIRINQGASDSIVLLLIGDNEFITSRAAVETWKLLSSIRNSDGYEILHISRIYTGFQREDKRSWLGFHDGVSNSPSNDRLQIISIDDKNLDAEDMWTANGTYMGFLRAEIDLGQWDAISRDDQSKIIGRDKVTGCPIISIDKNGKPIIDNRCPIPGTFEVIEKGNEIFREHPLFGNQRSLSKELHSGLENSHVARANPKSDASRNISDSYKIFRQGFQFFESTDFYPGFRVGINFMSYQNNPRKLFNIFERGFSTNSHSGMDHAPTLENFFSVRAAGIFFVPPIEDNEKFPGAGMFLDEYSTFSNRSTY